MSMRFELMSEVEVEDLKRRIEANYGASTSFLQNLRVLRTKREKVRIITQEALELLRKLSKYAIYAGLYLCKLKRNNKLQPSVEGAQMFATSAKRNVIRLDEEQSSRFLRGENISLKEIKDCESNNFVLVCTKRLCLGVGIIRKKGEDYVLESLFPKSRRIFFLS